MKKITKSKPLPGAMVEKFVALGTSDDMGRPVLTGVCVTKQFIVGCDGFQLHAAPTPSRLEQYIGKIVVDLATGEEVEGTFPDVVQIMPRSSPAFEVAVSTERLAKILMGMKRAGAESATLRFYTATSPIEALASNKDAGKMEGMFGVPTVEVQAKGEFDSLYAILMPTRLDENRKRWRPGQVEPDPAVVEQAKNEEAATALAVSNVDRDLRKLVGEMLFHQNIAEGFEDAAQATDNPHMRNLYKADAGQHYKQCYRLALDLAVMIEKQVDGQKGAI